MRPAPPPPAPLVTIGDQLAQAIRLRSDRLAYIDGETGHSWAAVEATSARLACGLLGLRLQRGDRIALIGANQIEWLLVFYAAARIGVQVVALSPQLGDRELAAMLGDSASKVVFTLDAAEGGALDRRIAGLVPQLPALRHVIAGDAAGLNGLAALAATPLDPGRLSVAQRRVQADDVALLIYTSGTTGRPKAAALSHRNLLASASAQAAHTRLGVDDLQHLASPLHHVAGISCGVLSHLVGGGTLVLVGDGPVERKLERLLALMQRHRPTLIAGSPTLLTRLLLQVQTEAIDFSALRLVISGGSPLDATLAAGLAARWPRATLMNLYGLSETSGAIAISGWDQPPGALVGQVGKPLPGAELRITGADGQALPPGQLGELWFRGCGVVPAYVGAAAGTGFSADGWLQTGDLGQVDKQGVIGLHGRKNEIYTQGGVSVCPTEVEALINRHPGVVLSAGIGVSDPELGEVGRVYVIARPGSGLREVDLHAWCAQHLAGAKRPRQILLREALPMTPAGKIHKAALRAESH